MSFLSTQLIHMKVQEGANSSTYLDGWVTLQHMSTLFLLYNLWSIHLHPNYSHHHITHRIDNHPHSAHHIDMYDDYRWSVHHIEYKLHLTNMINIHLNMEHKHHLTHMCQHHSSIHHLLLTPFWRCKCWDNRHRLAYMSNDYASMLS